MLVWKIVSSSIYSVRYMEKVARIKIWRLNTEVKPRIRQFRLKNYGLKLQTKIFLIHQFCQVKKETITLPNLYVYILICIHEHIEISNIF